jgi:hypothetical protein
MADENKGSNGDNKSGGDGGSNRQMTTEEIEAAAAKAKALIDDEKKKTGDDDKNKGGSVDDDDPTKSSTPDMDKTLKYVDKLKDENAQRRIENKKLADRISKTEEQLKEATKALTDATSRLKEVDAKTEEEKAKERSDLENASKKIEELTSQIGELQNQVNKSNEAAAKANLRVTKQNRETMIERLVEQQGAKFSSDFERDGLIASLTQMDGDGVFEKNNDEVIYDVMKFIETAPKVGEKPSVPGAGPQSKTTSTPIGDEIQSLLANKARLTPEQMTRLDELIAMSQQLQQAG